MSIILWDNIHGAVHPVLLDCPVLSDACLYLAFNKSHSLFWRVVRLGFQLTINSPKIPLNCTEEQTQAENIEMGSLDLAV